MPGLALASDDVIINEVNWAGSDSSSADEWLELYNSGSEIIDLKGWQLVDLVKDKLLVTMPIAQIPPNGFFLIANNSPDFKFSKGESSLAIEPDLIENNLSLSNSTLKLGLTDSNGVLIDEVGDSNLPPAGSSEEFRSMERTIDGDWISATESINLKMGFGTPMHSGQPQFLDSDCRLIKDKNEWLPISWPIIEYPENPIEKVLINGLDQEYVIEQGLLKINPRLEADNQFNLQIISSNGLADFRSDTCSIGQLSSEIKINELLPNPGAEGVEFVELINESDQAVSLSGWQIDDLIDGGSKPLTLQDLMIGAGDYLIVNLGSLKLNNSGDEFYLFNPLGEIVDSTSYANSPDGLSWSFYQGNWVWSESTPGTANRPAAKPVAILTEVAKASLSTVLADPSGQVFKVLVNVIEPLGTYSKDTVIIEDMGVFSELKLKGNPKLEAGDRISLCVKRSKTSNPRILEQKDCSLVIADHKDAYVAAATSPLRIFQKLKLSGIITKAERRTWLENEFGRWQITRKSGLNLPSLEEGDLVEVTGLVVALEPPRIRILTDGDLIVVSQKADVETEPQLLLSPSRIEERVSPVNLNPAFDKLFGLIDDFSQLQADTDFIGARVLGEKDTAKGQNEFLTGLVILSSILSLLAIGELLWKKLSTKQKAWQI